MLDITVIVLTFNEHLHIERCIRSVKDIAKRIVVVDSESTDDTREISSSLGADVYVNPWPGNQAAQFNWALDNTDIKTEWIFRLDADEYLMPNLIEELKSELPLINQTINGILIPRRNYWMQTELSKGSSNITILRLFRNGKGRSETRIMDEHIRLKEGSTIEFKHPFVDDNLNNLSWWSNKHINYAIREAAEMLDAEYNFTCDSSRDSKEELDKEAARKRSNKNMYSRMPLFWRSFAYFLYRYFFKGGFLEGKEGFLRHFLQGWWYRTLVDAKIYEIKKKAGDDPQKIKEVLHTEYGIKL